LQQVFITSNALKYEIRTAQSIFSQPFQSDFLTIVSIVEQFMKLGDRHSETEFCSKNHLSAQFVGSLL
jgi:hypothetical protein